MSITSITAGLSAILGVVSLGVAIWGKTEAISAQRSTEEINLALGRQKLAASEQKLNLERLDQDLKERAHNRGEETANREYALQIYKHVSDALAGNNIPNQQLALALVGTLPDLTLRDRIADAFRKAPTVSEEEKSLARTIQTEAATAASRLVNLDRDAGGRWTYDIFWCAGSNPRNQTRAKAVYDFLSQGGGRTVRMREPWTPEMNARNGYRAEGLQIRAEPGEEQVANLLRDVLLDAVRMDFSVHKIITTKPTRNYLSLFVCEA